MKTERLCDACGETAGKADDGRTVYNGWLLPMHESIGPVALCRAHWNESISKLADLILARRAAQPPKCTCPNLSGGHLALCPLLENYGFHLPPFPKVGAEVDPRTLPVGAVFHHVGSCDMHLRVTESGESCVCVKSGVTFVIASRTPAIVISLPPAEIELGTLSVGDWFDWSASEEMGEKFAGPLNCLRFLNRDGESLCEVNKHGWMFLTSRRVIRVPPPTYAGSDTLSEAHKSTGSRMHTGAAAAELPTDSGPSAGKSEPADSKLRWPNTPQSEHARLERMLAEQVATGGQDCKAARSLIERADRVRRELDRPSRPMSERFWNEDGSLLIKGTLRGIASIRLERPLIAWKRRK